MSFDPACIDDLMEYFRGEWHLTRHITDNKSGLNASVDGLARFSGMGHILNYTETGTMLHGEYRGIVTQNYIYDFTGPLAVNILFTDRGLFHKLELHSGQASVSHWCDPDQYEGHYHLQNQEIWVLVWKVKGPRKNNVILTNYTRLISQCQV